MRKAVLSAVPVFGVFILGGGVALRDGEKELGGRTATRSVAAETAPRPGPAAPASGKDREKAMSYADARESPKAVQDIRDLQGLPRDEALLRIAESGADDLVRARALAGLASRGADSSRIAAILRSTRDPELARHAVRALGTGEGVQAELASVLRTHPRPGIRAEAAVALGRSRSEYARCVLRSALETERNGQVAAIIRDSMGR